MLDYDVTELLSQHLNKNRRPPDGLLHPSGDLIGPLRHTMLRAAGAPTIESALISEVRMATGTSWHTEFEKVFRGKPGMFEVNLTDWLPAGWSGTADWLLWSRQYKAFLLHDLKTIKGDGLKYVIYEGAKEEHIWQGSAYWHACVQMGIPMLDVFRMYYLPMDVPSDNPGIEPVMIDVTPIASEVIHDVMEFRWEETQKYIQAVKAATSKWDKEEWTAMGPMNAPATVRFLNEHLAAEPERVQGLRYNRLSNQYDVKLLPHWSTRYCPYPDELCQCRHQKTEKIGHYVYDFSKELFYYVPRKGYQAIVQKVNLTPAMKKKLKEEDVKQAKAGG